MQGIIALIAGGNSKVDTVETAVTMALSGSSSRIGSGNSTKKKTLPIDASDSDGKLGELKVSF